MLNINQIIDVNNRVEYKKKDDSVMTKIRGEEIEKKMAVIGKEMIEIEADEVEEMVEEIEEAEEMVEEIEEVEEAEEMVEETEIGFLKIKIKHMSNSMNNWLTFRKNKVLILTLRTKK
mgnify:CR=1 FL=1